MRGTTAKLYGGGEGVDHLSVGASHGLLPATGPRRRLYTKSNMNTSTPSVIIMLTVFQPMSGTYV